MQYMVHPTTRHISGNLNSPNLVNVARLLLGPLSTTTHMKIRAEKKKEEQSKTKPPTSALVRVKGPLKRVIVMVMVGADLVRKGLKEKRKKVWRISHYGLDPPQKKKKYYM